MTDTPWTADFEIAGRLVRVRKTGAEVPLDRDAIRGFCLWLAFYLPVSVKRVANRLAPPGPALWFAPEQPRPWYLVWLAATWAGVRIAPTQEAADAAFYFDDVTIGIPPRTAALRRLNFECADISKSHVAKVFQAIFGYRLAIDPTRLVGQAVEKGETNGAHDGRVIHCPTGRRPGRVYQRLVDNIEDGQAVDLRTPFVGGRPIVVFVKRRPVGRRFANWNTSISLARPEEVFSAAEIERLSAFARAMRLDWGGLDILRDRSDGRLYVVDVNKTDMPPLKLPWLDKLRAIDRLGRALRALVSSQEEQS
jgi:hypothetical protein